MVTACFACLLGRKFSIVRVGVVSDFHGISRLYEASYTVGFTEVLHQGFFHDQAMRLASWICVSTRATLANMES